MELKFFPQLAKKPFIAFLAFCLHATLRYKESETWVS